MSVQGEYSIVPEIKYVVFRKCSPSWHIPEQSFTAWDITYLIAGNARYTINGADYDVAEGDLLCVPSRSVREAVTFPGRLMQCFSVDFELRKAMGASTSLPFPVLSRVGYKEDVVVLLRELSSAWLEKTPGYTLKINGLLSLIIHRFLELTVYKNDSSAMDNRIRKVTRYIAAHYSEKLTVQEMAEMIGLNAVYFGALFKRETNLTVKQYMTKTRMMNAENMLRSGEYKVAEVAEHCGYSDIFHFYKQFKATIGVPPSQLLPKSESR